MRTINIDGTATISKQPECMIVNVVVNSNTQDSVETSNQIADNAINELKQYCQRRGIKAKDIKLLEYKNSPVYQNVEKEVWNVDKTNKTVARERVFVGYQTYARLTFKFNFNMKKVAVIFSELGEIKNIAYHMEYALKNPEKEKHKVLEMAVKNARETADVLAAAAGSKVIAATTISYGTSRLYATREYACAKHMSADLECSSAIDDLGVEDLTITETVSIVFEIE